jgi:SAM-dependent methyltransferase
VRPALLALVVQLAAAALALGLLNVLSMQAAWWWPLQALLAASLSILARQPRWWWLIHLLFVPTLVLALQWGLSPWWYLLLFVLALLLFGRVDRSRVPLYLSNQAALQALEQVLPQGARLLDLGAGTGTVLRYLVRRKDLQLAGVEHACLPYWLAKLRLAGSGPALKLWRGDLMRTPLAEYDAVYAFLSPAAMPALWEKARREMRSGSLLISNTFTIPGQPADQVIELNDWKGARLYLWRMP